MYKAFQFTDIFLIPGSMIFEKIRAKVIAIQVVIKYNSTDTVPILPNVAILLKLETPLTIEKNTTGTINIFRDDIKSF